MTLEIYDLQIYQNYIVYIGYQPKYDKWLTYRIGCGHNDFCDMAGHILKSNLVMVGFDNIHGSWQILQYLTDNMRMFEKSSSNSICSQVVLKQAALKDGTAETVPEFRFTVKQIDLFRMWHLYNRNRRATLDDIKFSYHMQRICTLPRDRDRIVEDTDEIDCFCKNNTETIYKFFLTTIGQDRYPLYNGVNKIAFRNALAEKYKISVTNTADAVLGKRMILYLYSRAAGIPVSEIREMKTPRDTVNLGACIPEFCAIKSPEFNEVIKKWKDTVIKADTENDIRIPVMFHDTRFVFSLGGLHSVANPGVFISDDKYTIMDYDVQSLYPSIGKYLGLYPEHLGPVFNKLYTQFIDEKLEEDRKENPDKAKRALLKIMLNAIYGNSNESKSFLYDPMYTYRTTIAGQVFTAMWCELLVKVCKDVRFLSVNTDGICCLVPKDEADMVGKLNDAICRKFGFAISSCEYSRLIIRDTNNYIAIYPDNSKENEHLKLRGCFEIYSEYYRDTSKKVIQKALKEYFVYNVPIEKTIMEDTDIYDFCLKAKAASMDRLLYRTITNGKIQSMPIGPFVRYYISTAGQGSVVKITDTGSQTILHPGKSCMLLNNNDIKDYKIDYSFYISEACKIKDSIISSQLTLF